MAYTIYKADGTAFTVPDNAISQQFYNPTSPGGVGVQLIGRNAIDYGAAMAQNLLQLASNFAGPTVPPDATSTQGQTWFNTSNLLLYVKGNNATSGGITNWIQLGTNSESIGTPLYNITGTVIGYTTNSIPSNANIANYVSLDTPNHNGFLGWLRTTAGNGMTLQITKPDSTLIGYAFPA